MKDPHKPEQQEIPSVDFIANFSHELRNSLNSIVLLSKLLMENRPETMNGDQLEYAAAIHNSGNSLLELVNEVLDLSKLATGEMDIELVETDLQAQCRKIEQIYTPVALAKGLFFAYENSLAGDGRMVTDRLHLEQVLRNLLSNALKFTPEGGITLRTYQPTPQELDIVGMQGTPTVALQVRDTGIGIPGDKLEVIFERFRQADPRTHRQYGGTGLGLSISRELAAILGGTISVQSTPGNGSSFTLYLPIDSRSVFEQREADHSMGHPRTTSGLRPPLPGNTKTETKAVLPESTVLLVDDSELQTTALKEFLEFQIGRCLVASTAKQAYALMEKETISCIILDMFLPDADGYEVLDKIKSKPGFAHLPVIIYTGLNLTSEELDQVKQNAASVVYKNADSFKVLLSEVAAALQSHA